MARVFVPEVPMSIPKSAAMKWFSPSVSPEDALWTPCDFRRRFADCGSGRSPVPPRPPPIPPIREPLARRDVVNAMSPQHTPPKTPCDAAGRPPFGHLTNCRLRRRGLEGRTPKVHGEPAAALRNKTPPRLSSMIRPWRRPSVGSAGNGGHKPDRNLKSPAPKRLGRPPTTQKRTPSSAPRLCSEPWRPTAVVSPLPEKLLHGATGQWEDIFELLRLREAAWGGQVFAVPMGSPTFVCYYRADLLEKLGRQPPRTWDEYQELAQLLARKNPHASGGRGTAPSSRWDPAGQDSRSWPGRPPMPNIATTTRPFSTLRRWSRWWPARRLFAHWRNLSRSSKSGRRGSCSLIPPACARPSGRGNAAWP